MTLSLKKLLASYLDLLTKRRLAVSAFCLTAPVYILSFCIKHNEPAWAMAMAYSFYAVLFLSNVKYINPNRLLFKFIAALGVFILLWMGPSLYIVFFSGRIESEWINLWGLSARAILFVFLMLSLFTFCLKRKDADFNSLMIYLAIALGFIVLMTIIGGLIYYINSWNFSYGHDFTRANIFGWQPNYAACLIFIFILSLQKLHLKLIKVILTLVCLTVMIILFQSRGYFIASLIALTIFYFPCIFNFFKKLPKKNLVFSFVITISLVVIFYQEIIFLMSKMFIYRYRGLDSGLTGRFDLWQHWWQSVLSYPWSGIGHAQSIVGQGIGRYDTPHNFFLRIAVENGLILTVFVLMITVMATHKLLKKKMPYELGCLMAIMFAYQFDNWSINLWLLNAILYLVLLRAFFSR